MLIKIAQSYFHKWENDTKKNMSTSDFLPTLVIIMLEASQSKYFLDMESCPEVIEIRV